ncbi:MAG: hypothetical protein CMB06_01175 [Euryarchaeota archaeon]|nr:hypothetical protein [Euryarchaeota archaeon]
MLIVKQFMQSGLFNATETQLPKHAKTIIAKEAEMVKIIKSIYDLWSRRSHVSKLVFANTTIPRIRRTKLILLEELEDCVSDIWNTIY